MPAVAHRGRGRRTISEINMVPFIDVMLVLLIIFMVTAPLITPSMIDLPSMGKAKAQPDQVIEVVITKTEALQLRSGDKTVSTTLKEVASAVQRSIAPPKGADKGQINAAIVISADKSVKYETMIKVMDTLQRADIQRVGLSVQMVP